MNLDEKIEKVENTIKNRKIAIAFSGGADSTLLAYLASKVSDKPIAITIDNHIFPTGFIKHCKKTAKEFGITHKVIDLNCELKKAPHALLYASTKMPDVLIRGSNHSKS